MNKRAASALFVVLCFFGCKSDLQTVAPLSTPVPEPVSAPSAAPPTAAVEQKAPKLFAPKKRSTVDIASRPIPAGNRQAIDMPSITGVQVSAKPTATLALEEVPPQPLPARTTAVAVTPRSVSRLRGISPKVWYCLASIFGAMFTYILAPLIVELLKDCMPRRRHPQVAAAWAPLQRLPHYRSWLRRG